MYICSKYFFPVAVAQWQCSLRNREIVRLKPARAKATSNLDVIIGSDLLVRHLQVSVTSLLNITLQPKVPCCGMWWHVTNRHCYDPACRYRWWRLNISETFSKGRKQTKIIDGCYFELIVINHYLSKIKVLVGNTFIANKTSVGFLLHSHALDIIYFIP